MLMLGSYIDAAIQSRQTRPSVDQRDTYGHAIIA